MCWSMKIGTSAEVSKNDLIAVFPGLRARARDELCGWSLPQFRREGVSRREGPRLLASCTCALSPWRDVERYDRRNFPVRERRRGGSAAHLVRVWAGRRVRLCRFLEWYSLCHFTIIITISNAIYA